MNSRPNAPADTHSPETPVSPELWTIGHSTRPIEEFVGLLQSHGIQVLVDVRTIPFSRRNPQFHQATLAQSLREGELQYRHMRELGGRRKTRADSLNAGWRNEGFRGYADYMQTQEFWDGLEGLMATGRLSCGGHYVRKRGPFVCSTVKRIFVDRRKPETQFDVREETLIGGEKADLPNRAGDKGRLQKVLLLPVCLWFKIKNQYIDRWV